MTIDDLLDLEVAFLGSDWVEDESVTDGPLPGYRYNGQKPFINCNDEFVWGSADGEDITDELMPEFQRAVDDCDGDVHVASLLYCARRRGMRPQGAMYTYIPGHLWHLFDDCGPEREVGFGNPYRPGEYKRQGT